MSKARIVYLGNQLSGHGVNPTSVETLGQRLKKDFTVIRASSKANKWFRLIDMWLTVIRERKADFAIIDTYSTSAFVFAWTSAAIAAKFGLKYIPILHGGALPERARNSPGRLKSYLSNAYRVVCPSPYLKEEMMKVIDMDYKVVANAIDLADYPFTSRKRLNKAGPRLLWVRAFDKIYNPTLAVRVLKGLIDHGYEQAHLCMVGPDKDGSLSEVKELAEELNIADKVKFTGSLSKQEWVILSGEYDVFINTTHIDNTPVSLIESLALGLPVISTRVGGIPHILKSGENAVLVEPDCAKAFVEAIQSLGEEQLYQKLVIQGRATAENYDWKQVKAQWSDILK